MSQTNTLIWCLGLVTILLFMQPNAGACECIGIFEQGPWACHSTGCSGEYTTETCAGGGCIYGEYCYSTGPTVCCNIHYNLYNVYTGECDPQFVCENCGAFSTHNSSQLSSSNARSPEARVGFEGRLGFPPEAPLLVPDRCRHSYGIYSEEFRLQPRRVSRVQTVGGL